MLYIITAVHNRNEITKKFVENLLSQSYKDFTLILVDDGSTDGTAELVKRMLPSAVILKGNGNLWWGGALHLAVKTLTDSKSLADDNDIVLFSNDDVSYDANYLATGLELIRNRKKTLLVGRGFDVYTGIEGDGALDRDFRKIQNLGVLPPNTPGKCASTRSTFCRVGDLKIIGGFHPILLPHYSSDWEWTIRAYKKGYSIISEEKLKYQYDSMTTGERNLDTFTVKKLFSKKTIYNPVYTLSFVFLSTPKKDLLYAIVYQLKKWIHRISDVKKIVKR